MSLHVVDGDEATGGPLLSVPGVVALLAEHDIVLSQNKLYRWLDAGVIPSTRVGGDADGKGARYVIHKFEVLDWLAFGRVNRYRQAPAPPPAVTPQVIAEGLQLLIQGLARRAG